LSKHSLWRDKDRSNNNNGGVGGTDKKASERKQEQDARMVGVYICISSFGREVRRLLGELAPRTACLAAATPCERGESVHVV
jgi:hypothetical protein